MVAKDDSFCLFSRLHAFNCGGTDEQSVDTPKTKDDTLDGNLSPIVKESQVTVDHQASDEVIAKLLLTDFWSDDKKVVLYALNLANISYCKDKMETKRVAINAAGGHMSILGVMKKWKESAKIQAKGSNFLADCAWENEPFADSAVKFGAIPTILLAMQKYPDHVSVQSSACYALYSLLTNVSDSLAACRAINVPLVVEAMQMHPTIAKLQHHAICILLIISEYDTDVVLQAGGLEALGAAYSHHLDYKNNEDHMKVRNAARSSMKRLLTGSKDQDQIDQNSLICMAP